MHPYLKLVIKSLAAGVAAISATTGASAALGSPQSWFFFFWPGVVGALIYCAGAVDTPPSKGTL